MNYRHSFHAGNSADVFKHTLLIALVHALHQKPGALTLIDTHAGCGLYDLGSDEARRTGEATTGVLQALRHAEPLLAGYHQQIAAVNGDDETITFYPGSPQILAQLLRTQDKLILNELHPDDADLLKSSMRGSKATIHQRDGYEFWLAMVPPAMARGLVVVDPPFEQPDERARLTATLAAAHRKWAHGVTLLWYPLKDRARQWQWDDAMRALGLPKLLRIEHWLYDHEQPDHYNGSGVYIVNPPYAFTEALSPLLAALRRALAPPGQTGSVIADWITA